MSQAHLTESIPAAAGAEVAVLVHDHRHGVDVQVFASYDAARRQRAAIARRQWASLAQLVDELPATPPDDDDLVADIYFGHDHEEDASILVQSIAADPAELPTTDENRDEALDGLLAVAAGLNDVRAHALMYAVATTRSWPYAVWCAADVECALMGHTDWPLDRDLTPAQWRAVAATPAWDQVAEAAYQAVNDSEIVRDAIRQAGLICVDCAAVLDGPLTTTWGRCPTCRAATPLATLQHSACPGVEDADHDWRPEGCTRCGLPAPELVRCTCCQRYVARAAAHDHRDGPVADLCCPETHPAGP